MNLAVFLSDRCNMECDYCFLDLNRGPAVTLAPEAARRAFAEFARRRADSPTVTFLGGEPMAHWPLLRELIGVARDTAPGAAVSVVTNGAAATPERLRALAGLGVGIILSLDGGAAANDRHRRLVGAPGASARARVLRGLGDFPRESLEVNLTVCEDTAASLFAEMEGLRREGFRRLKFTLKIQERWPEAALRALALEAGKLAAFHRGVAARAPGALTLCNLDTLRGGGGNPDCDSPDPAYQDVVLGADGRYYPCYALLALPYGSPALEAWAVGDAFGGLDRDKRDVFHRRARDFIHARIGTGFHYRCPREAYFLALATDADPEAAVRSYAAAQAAVGDVLAPLAEETRA